MENENPTVLHAGRDGEENYQLGWQYYARGEYPQAIDEVKTALSKTPDHPDYLYTLGLAYEATHQKDEAVQAFNQVIQNLQAVQDQARANMIRRMAQAHINKIMSGDWGAFTNPEHV